MLEKIEQTILIFRFSVADLDRYVHYHVALQEEAPVRFPAWSVISRAQFHGCLV